jgi:hypothetical protein
MKVYESPNIKRSEIHIPEYNFQEKETAVAHVYVHPTDYQELLQLITVFFKKKYDANSPAMNLGVASDQKFV